MLEFYWVDIWAVFHKLQNMVAMKWNQFMGYAQHDAQEFMAFLLDGLHEVILSSIFDHHAISHCKIQDVIPST